MAVHPINHSKTENKTFVYFPLQTTIKSGLAYGTVIPSNNYSNCWNIYITSLDPDDETLEQPLLGTFNNDFMKSSTNEAWVELRSEGSQTHVVRLFLDHALIPLSNIVLILYDATFLQSEILENNIDWKQSQCLSELGSLLTKRKCSRRPDEMNLNGDDDKISESPVNSSKVILQLRQRALQWRSWRRSQSECVSYNLLLMVMLDLLLGFFFVEIFHSVGGTNQVLEMFLASVKVIADNLQILIKWLMGVPVGLKLNRPLSTVLGKFFLYHLYLWKTYIDIIRPVVSAIISISSTVGFIGLSFQMALLSDLITLASLHSYCFYVYAARLYGVTLHGLRSTLRMFGGRKWNPLRNRVDSGHFSWDQLCVGMFIFSSLLLLLPTILVYYVVFLALRLGVLVVQGTIKRLIWLINGLPSYSLLLWILNSPSVAGDVQLQVMPSTSTATLKLIWIRLPLMQSIQRALNPSTPDCPWFNWSQRLAEMFSGQLIYPL